MSFLLLVTVPNHLIWLQFRNVPTRKITLALADLDTTPRASLQGESQPPSHGQVEWCPHSLRSEFQMYKCSEYSEGATRIVDNLGMLKCIDLNPFSIQCSQFAIKCVPNQIGQDLLGWHGAVASACIFGLVTPE